MTVQATMGRKFCRGGTCTTYAFRNDINFSTSLSPSSTMSLLFRRMAHTKPTARPDLGPPPESAPPSQMQRGIQALAFVATACKFSVAREGLEQPTLSAEYFCLSLQSLELTVYSFTTGVLRTYLPTRQRPHTSSHLSVTYLFSSFPVPLPSLTLILHCRSEKASSAGGKTGRPFQTVTVPNGKLRPVRSS